MLKFLAKNPKKAAVVTLTSLAIALGLVSSSAALAGRGEDGDHGDDQDDRVRIESRVDGDDNDRDARVRIESRVDGDDDDQDTRVRIESRVDGE